MAPPRPPLPPGLAVLLLAMATGHAHVAPLFAKSFVRASIAYVLEARAA